MAGGGSIEFTRSGGFAGLTLETTVELAELPAAERERLETLIESVDWKKLAAAPPTPPAVDRFQYELVVEGHGHRHSLSLGEKQVPAELRPLIDYLTARAESELTSGRQG